MIRFFFPFAQTVPQSFYHSLKTPPAIVVAKFTSTFILRTTTKSTAKSTAKSTVNVAATVAGIISTVLALSGGGNLSVSAAERVSVQLGPVHQTIAIDDLDRFATTGEIPLHLRAYTPVLTEDVQFALNSYLPFDPAVSDDLVADLLQSSTGEQIFEALELLIPESSPDKIEMALKHASQNSDGLSALGFLSAYPDPTLTIDVAAAVTLASQLNLPHWQRGLLNSILGRELATEHQLERVPFDPTLSGYAQVNRETLTLHDEERDRAIPVDLYWSEWPQGPLVVISHGFAADRRFFYYLAEHLASHGLTVAAIEHPTSNVAWLNGITLGVEGGSHLSDILPITEFIDRPKDIHFLLDELERLGHELTAMVPRSISSEASSSGETALENIDLRGTVIGDQNPFAMDDVTVIGHSLGGYTALALAGAPLDLKSLRQFCSEHSVMELAPADWLQCRAVDLPGDAIAFHDPRVTQVIAVNPVMARIFGESSLAQISVPTLISAASEDFVTPAVTQQLLPFTAFQSDHRYLLTAIGATHLSMGDPLNLNPALTENMMLRERTHKETVQMRTLFKGLSLAFIKQQTPEAELYAPFLHPGYIESWSNERIQLRLSSDLPPTLKQWLRMASLPMERVVSATLPKKKANAETRSLYTATLHLVSGGVVLMLFMPPAGMTLGSVRQLNRCWKKAKSSRKPQR